MDFYTLVQRRESCRQYEDRPVEPEKIDQMLACARLAPSACNSQPWPLPWLPEKKPGRSPLI